MIPTNSPIQTKHGTQMMITKTAKNTSSKKIFIHNIHSTTPQKRWGWTNRFLLQVVYKKNKANSYNIYTFTKNKQKVENLRDTRVAATASIISPSWKLTPRPEDLKSEIRSLANDLELKAAQQGKNRGVKLGNWVKWRCLTARSWWFQQRLGGDFRYVLCLSLFGEDEPIFTSLLSPTRRDLNKGKDVFFFLGGGRLIDVIMWCIKNTHIYVR